MFIASGVVCLLMAAAIATWVATATTVTGTVTCTSGAKVTGVWAEGDALGHLGPLAVNAGFAEVQHTGPGTASFTWTRHLRSGQEFHVGCGGSGEDWAFVGYSYLTTNTSVTLVCDDSGSSARTTDRACRLS